MSWPRGNHGTLTTRPSRGCLQPPARRLSACRTPQSCTNLANVQPKMVLLFLWDFLEGAGMALPSPRMNRCYMRALPCKRPSVLWTAESTCCGLWRTPRVGHVNAQQRAPRAAGSQLLWPRPFCWPSDCSTSVSTDVHSPNGGIQGQGL